MDALGMELFMIAKYDRKDSIELYPDAMERFERAVKAVTKSPPQHRAAKKKKTSQKRRAKKAT
jgi:hypothetical protein